jgi:hypothetical protein
MVDLAFRPKPQQVAYDLLRLSLVELGLKAKPDL